MLPCRRDPDMWFDHTRADRAIAECGFCPARTDCLARALAMTADDDGVWGGTTPLHRQAIRDGKLTASGAMSQADEQAARGVIRRLVEENAA